jgi:hypothetical protein
MSGYLARLAARGGGAPSAAGPRLPSRFEPSTIDAPTQGTAPGPSPVTPARDGWQSSTELGATRADEGEAAAMRTPADALAALPIPAERRREAQGTDAEHTVPALPTNAAFGERRATEHGVPTPLATVVATAARRLDPAPPPRAPAPRVDAAPPPESAGAITAVPAREAASSAPEPDVVHVTIGRVEVRATIAAQTAAPHAPRPPRDTERDLHDYLTGSAR